MKKYAFIFFTLLSAKCFSQINVVPMPAEVKMGQGKFILNSKTTIILGHSPIHEETYADYLNKILEEKYGFKLKILRNNNQGLKNNLLELSFTPFEVKPVDSYTLNVTAKNVSIVSYYDKGLFYGIQTLLQLIENNTKQSNTKPQTPNNKLQTTNIYTIPQLTITDYPRFPYRGMHLDVCRHFFPVDYVKKYIDYLAAYKYNTFHWHLTEDQGWRIEIKKYPNLTKVGSYRDRTLIGRYGSNTYDSIKYGGYYTQTQIKDIVQYAKERYITVIPEIEMPGHSTAALASYPFLGCTKGPYKVMDTWGVLDDVYCAGNDSTFTFLQNVLDEVMQLFPSKYIHIGGDECPKERWKKCVACQKRMKDNNLKDEHALQSYFIQRMEKYLNSKGRSIIGWDEILEGGLAPNATVMSWRGEEGGIEAAKQNHDVIMTPGSHCYLDHSQSKNEDSLTIGSYLPLEKIYNYEPVPAVLNAEQQTHILGAQGNVWTEYIANTSKLEYMVFPRMIALSEVLWSPKDKRNWKDFERRLPTIFERLDKDKINYSKAYYDLEAKILPKEDNDGVYLQLLSKTNTRKIYYNKNCSDDIVGIPINESGKLQINSSGNYCIFSAQDVSKVISKSEKSNIFRNTYKEYSYKFSFNKATGKKITLVNPPHKTYPGDGAFTLVNGVQNEKGTARSSEFVGFQGTDLDATIDFGKDVEISTIKLHTLNQNRSWIYLPTEIEVSFMPYIDTTVITRHPPIVSLTQKVTDKNNLQVIKLTEPKMCRYLRVYAKNFGTIPAGQPGEGKQAWLFVDEIEPE
jgi:hexosaminidase